MDEHGSWADGVGRVAESTLQLSGRALVGADCRSHRAFWPPIRRCAILFAEHAPPSSAVAASASASASAEAVAAEAAAAAAAEAVEAGQDGRDWIQAWCCC